MVEPLSPSAAKHKVPDVVLTIFNDLILANWDGQEARVMREDAMQRITAATNLSRKQVYDKKLLDVEEQYREAGWKVEHQQPARGDSDYPPFYRFTK